MPTKLDTHKIFVFVVYMLVSNLWNIKSWEREECVTRWSIINGHWVYIISQGGWAVYGAGYKI